MGAQGQTTIDFGAFPGNTLASVAVTGQASIVGTSLAEAWLFPVATADHSFDEHIAEMKWLKVIAGNVVAGTGFTIYAEYDNPLKEPMVFPGQRRNAPNSTTAGQNGLQQGTVFGSVGGVPIRIYGQWTVAWVWN